MSCHTSRVLRDNDSTHDLAGYFVHQQSREISPAAPKYSIVDQSCKGPGARVPDFGGLHSFNFILVTLHSTMETAQKSIAATVASTLTTHGVLDSALRYEPCCGCSNKT